MDTLELRLLPGLVRQHFTTRDVISRWDVCEVHSTAASLFLDTLLARTPFPIRAIQVDGGSEFQALFEQACQQRRWRLFGLPPRSPNSMAPSSVPNAVTPRSFMKSHPVGSRFPHGIVNSITGNIATTPSPLTRRSIPELLPSSSLRGQRNRKLKSATNLLDEYKCLTRR